MKKPDTESDLRIRPRSAEVVSIKVPAATLASLKKVAERRDMSYDALIKFYIGQGLWQDLALLATDNVLQATAEVLAQHIESKDEVAAILEEIGQANRRRWYPWLTRPLSTDT
jgi:ABC-type histidine transport system ATPase subunit